MNLIKILGIAVILIYILFVIYNWNKIEIVIKMHQLKRLYIKLDKINEKILKICKELIELEKNPPSLISALFWCLIHPIFVLKQIMKSKKKKRKSNPNQNLTIN